VGACFWHSATGNKLDVVLGKPHPHISVWGKGVLAMQLNSYVETVRRRRADLTANRAFIADSGMEMRSNWGSNTTKVWISELDRRINELSAIITALEKGRPI
jgi:hypothetical protein